MNDIARELSGSGVLYYPYVEAKKGAARGLPENLAKSACIVVTDDYPSNELRSLVNAAARKFPVLAEKVDSNGALPLRATDRVFKTAASFRVFLKKNLAAHLCDVPTSNPLSGAKFARRAGINRSTLKRWPPAASGLLAGASKDLAKLRIDHSVPPVKTEGGMSAAQAALRGFIRNRLFSYAELRNHPDYEATSGLSPYLRAGQISSHQVLAMVAKHEGLSRKDLEVKPEGRGRGWWRMSESAQAFVDQLLTWRELGFNMAWQNPDYNTYESLPDWARRSLEKHARDRRRYIYSLADFEAARTHDRLWNAAQMQLVCEGLLHNYLRMLWGKKILEWTASPRDALEVMIELNNKYALDGRDPNSYSGISWILGRYDRAWGPERLVFGKIRYMSSENTLRKVRARKYMDKFAPQGDLVESAPRRRSP
jgi:deoxyribodipyrimidine photo-lyase